MKKLLAIAIIAVLTGGCKKMLNEPDHSVLTTELLFNSSRDLENLLFGAYSAIGNGYTLTGSWRVIPEVMADHVVVNVSEQLPEDPYPALYSRDMNSARYITSWQQAYTAIQNANTVLYALDNNLITKEMDPEFNDVIRDRTRGEALFIRAIVHFELVRLYGHQYGYNSTAPNSGVILRTQPLINVTTKEQLLGARRTTVDSVYQQVIADLKIAETLMPPVAPKRGRANSYAASAYLARVYFQQGNYDAALEQIVKVIGSVPGSIETTAKLYRSPATGTLSTANAQANVLAPFNTTAVGDKLPENIFDIVSVTNAAANTFINRKYFRSATIEPHLAASNTFITEAAFAANDQRKAHLMTAAGGKNYSKKYDRALLNIPIIRSAEMVLDRAEIWAMKGQTEDATKDVNMIRDRAIPGYNINTVISAANILAEVRRERVRELAFEGDRLHNLRRLNQNIGRGDRAATVVPVPWNSNQLLFKIPDVEVSNSNGGVIQNPD